VSCTIIRHTCEVCLLHCACILLFRGTG
jgi:hypothetical protein